jgi:type VI protein secretion system component VasK
MLAAIAKVAGQVGHASKGASLAMLHTLINDVVSVLALTVVTSILGALLVAALFWGMYYGLLWLGLMQWAALATTIGIACLLIIILAALTIARMRDLKMPLIDKVSDDQHQAPSLADRAHGVTDAFLSGFRRQQRPTTTRFY